MCSWASIVYATKSKASGISCYFYVIISEVPYGGVLEELPEGSASSEVIYRVWRVRLSPYTCRVAF